MLSVDAFSRAQMRLAAGLHQDPLPPDPLAAIRGGVLLLRGRKRREMEGKGKRRKGKGRKGVKEGKGRELPPLYITSGYGRDVCLYLSTILPTCCNNLVEVIAKLKTHN